MSWTLIFAIGLIAIGLIAVIWQSKRMDSLSERMDSLSERMDVLSDRIDILKASKGA